MLFADLSGYTALAESLDPEEVYHFLRPTMAQLQAIVESYGGSVPQVMGDGFMAVFGVPVAHEDDAERAVRAALAVRDHVRALNEVREGLAFPQVHAGVNSGEVMVGPSDEAAGFAVIGDTVNTASRLADIAPPGRVMVDRTTWRRTRDRVRYGPARKKRAKGKSEELVVHEALHALPSSPEVVPARTGGFVDREEVLARLGAELESAERDRLSRVLVITGEPGVGKSRLARELAHSLPPGRFLVGRCWAFGDHHRLSALAEVTASALGVLTGDESGRTVIEAVARRIGGGRHAAVAADLCALLEVDDPESSRRGDRDVLLAARSVIEDLARGGAVVVVLDDLQWADPSIAEMLAEAEAGPWHAPVLLLGLSREPVGDLPSLPLPGLDEGSMRTLAMNLLGGTEPVPIASQVARSGGNPLFLEETVGMLVERGAMQRRGGAWRIVDPDVAREMPAAIRLVIAARLDGLPADEKRVLQDASVCGSVVWDAFLEEVGGADVERAILALISRGFLDRAASSSIPGTPALEWKHELIRDVAYSSMPRSVRSTRHIEVAEWLRRRSKRREPVGAIAHHYERAWELRQARTGPGPSDELAYLAAEYLTRRGELVFARQARAAEPLFRRALEIAAAGGRAMDPRIVARACLGLAEVLIEMGEHVEAIHMASRARRQAERSGDERLVARALLALGRSEADAGHMSRARTLLEDARKSFETEGDLRGQAWAYHRLSETWGWQGYERELENLREAYRLFSRARDRFGRSVTAQDLAYILSVQGGREFHRWYELSRHLADDEGDLRSHALLLRTWGYFCYAAGRHAEAIGTMAACRPAAADAGDRYAETDALLVAAFASANEGDPAHAAGLATEAASIGRELGSIRIPTMARMALARASVRLGKTDAAGRLSRMARDSVRSRRLRVLQPDLAETTAMILLDRGAWARARVAARELATALRAVPTGLLDPLPSMIEGWALLGSGDAARALRKLEEACRIAGRAGATGTLDLARALARQAAFLAGTRPARRADGEGGPGKRASAITWENEAIVALLAGSHDAATAAIDRAVELWEAMGSTACLARALGMRADILSAAGDRARAAASRSRARAVADQVRMPAPERASIEHPLGIA